MSETYSLLEFLRELVRGGGLHADFVADPHALLTAHGLAGLPAQDVQDAFVMVEDTRTVDFDPDHVPSPRPAPAIEWGGDPAVHFVDAYLAEHWSVPAVSWADPDAGALPTSDGPDDVTRFGAGQAGGHAHDHASGHPAGFAVAVALSDGGPGIVEDPVPDGPLDDPALGHDGVDLFAVSHELPHTGLPNDHHPGH